MISDTRLITSNLFEEVLLAPARRGGTELFVLSGYASASMVTRHFEVVAKELACDLSIDLHIGMSGRDGISRNTLLGLQAIPRQIRGRAFNCTLSIRGLSNHSKLYVWCDDNGPKEAYLGSSNYTQVGFGISRTTTNHSEVCVAIDPITGLDYILSSSQGGISYKSPDIGDFIDIHDDQLRRDGQSEVDANEVGSENYVDLPLVMTRLSSRGEVHEKSGLNWGQREGRNPDQAYIPIPAPVARAKFFPEKNVHFQMVTDDGQAFICTVAQDNDKALETPHDNALLGRYFRERLGLPPGAFIKKEHLLSFGSNLVRIYKDNDDSYRLSFQSGRLIEP